MDYESADFTKRATNMVAPQAAIINLYLYGKRRWRGGFNVFNVCPLVAYNTLLIYYKHLHLQGNY